MNLIGKRVRIKNAINVCYMSKKADVVGILSFVGKNEYLDNRLQCTVNRMPIELESINQIELCES